MPAKEQCGGCGGPLPRDAPLGHCPACLIALAAEPMPQRTPGRFGDYELLEVIGRGGMGVVYKARQVSLNRVIALKMLNSNTASFPQVAERLCLEAEVAASLHHPNIVTIYDFGEHDGHPFFTMALVEGARMDMFIGKSGYCFARPGQSGRVSTRDAQASVVQTFLAIVRAVDYAHKHGVLHRDLKPANIVIDQAGEPHLTDFGLAKILGKQRDRQTETGSVLGTPAYMAPEQATGGTNRVSTAADIYSLGALFYAMLTGDAPFRGENPLETLRKVTEEEPRPPSTVNASVDADLSTICLKCLDKDPKRRYATALALAEDLERWLRREPISARPVGAAGRFWRWCRREPRLAGMAGGVFLALVAITILALTLYYRERDRLAVAREEKARQKSVLFRRIDTDATLGGRNGVRVYASELAVLADRPFAVEGNEHVVVLGVHLPRQAVDPLQVLQRFAPLANCLQTNRAVRPNVPLLVELQIYTSYSNALAGLEKGEADVMLLTAASYLEYRKRDPKIQPLVRFTTFDQRSVRNAIFCRPESMIKELSDLKGKSFAFTGLDQHLIEASVKAELWKAGLKAQDFSQVATLPRGMVIGAVRSGKVDAGVASVTDLERLRNSGVSLHILGEVAGSGYVWVTTGRLQSTEAIEAIRERLLATRDSEVFAALDETLAGFEPVTNDGLKDVEQSLGMARLFDNAR